MTSAQRGFLIGFRERLSPMAAIVASMGLSAVVFQLVTAYWLARPLPWGALVVLISVIESGQLLGLSYARSKFPRFPWWARIVGGSILSALIYSVVRGQMSSGQVSQTTFTSIAAALIPLQCGLQYLCWRHSDQAHRPSTEPMRWMLLAVTLVALHRPLLTAGAVGAGDSYWYSIMVADFVTQWREGVFPVFVGQSEFAFNGAVSPLRFAPALQHFAGLVDLATLRSLNFHALLNLTLLCCFVGAAFTCYLSLRAIEPRASWLAWLLSFLFSACPGVLALVYVGDLFMSITAVPFLPLVLYGCWRTFTRGDTAGVVILAAAVSALWYCHPPIALWATGGATLIQLFRLPREWRQASLWRGWALGAVLFGLLGFYNFASVKILNFPPFPTSRPAIIENLKTASPGFFRPVSKVMNLLSDYQLGWALWAVVICAVVGLLFVRPLRLPLALLAVFSGMLAVLIPSPLLTMFWTKVPTIVCDITFMWPMQRIYAQLAVLAVFLVFLTLGTFSAQHRWLRRALTALFLIGALWSANETRKFQAHAFLSTTPPTQARDQHRPQNHVLTRYSFNPFRTIPPYFSHGFIDPRLPNRLLAQDDLHELASNHSAIEQYNDPLRPAITGNLATVRPDPDAPTLAVVKPLHIEPNKLYALTFDFSHPEFTGSLSLRGVHTNRNYWMPHSGFGTITSSPSRAFGASPTLRHSLTLWTDQPIAEDVKLTFFFSDAGPEKPVKTLGDFRMQEIDPSKLPVAIESWTPYRARVAPTAAAWLETPRLFMDGYRAKVNGAEAKVAPSKDGLVMISVPAGSSQVELTFPGQPLLRFAYYLSLATWILALGYFTRSQILD